MFLEANIMHYFFFSNGGWQWSVRSLLHCLGSFLPLQPISPLCTPFTGFSRNGSSALFPRLQPYFPVREIRHDRRLHPPLGSRALQVQRQRCAPISLRSSPVMKLILTVVWTVLHDPESKFSKKELEKMGYCRPIVDHASARIRAIARYKKWVASWGFGAGDSCWLSNLFWLVLGVPIMSRCRFAFHRSFVGV